MSRCFPFPPPGYVKKTNEDDVNSLKKEKEREKKHRTNKRIKEKRESKERKEKGRSEGKHGDKKEKKEKRGDKTKDRDKEKKEKKCDPEKDRFNTSEERRHSEQQTDGGNSKEKIVDKGRPPEQILGTFVDMEKEKNRPHVLDARRVGGQFPTHSAVPKSIEKNHNIQKTENNLSVHKPVDAIFVAELGKRVRDEGGVTAQSSEKVAVNGKKKDAGMTRILNGSSGPLADRKERGQERRGDGHRLNGQVVNEREVGGTVALQNLSISVQMCEGMPRPPKTCVEEKMAGSEKIREKKSKHLGPDKLTVLDLQRIKNPGEDKGQDREKKNDERTKKVDNRVHEEEKLREREIDSLDPADANNIVVHVLEEVNKIVPSTVNDKKRKSLEPNGFLHENETRQIKLPRPLLAHSHPLLVENGGILDAPQSTNQCLPVRQGQPDMVKADKPKGQKSNGIPEKKPDLMLSSLDSASLELLDEKAITRSPHPELKYLDEVLTVPKFEDLVLPEDYEWLFGSRLELQNPGGVILLTKSRRPCHGFGQRQCPWILWTLWCCHMWFRFDRLEEGKKHRNISEGCPAESGS